MSTNIQAQLQILTLAARDLSPTARNALFGILGHFEAELKRLGAEPPAAKPDPVLVEQLKTAGAELREVTTETAKAVDALTQAAQLIEKLSRRAHPSIAGDMARSSTRIYEACAFQDITGQRINKAIACIEAIGTDAPKGEVTGDAALLNGPQVAGQANSQADIDALFAA